MASMRWFGLSLFIHILLFLGLTRMDSPHFVFQQLPPVSIDLTSPPPEFFELIQDNQAHLSQNETDKKNKFMGEQARQTQVETQQRPSPPQRQTNRSRRQLQKILDTFGDDNMELPPLVQQPRSRLLDDVAVGAVTSLNQGQLTYASFYSRIHSAVEYPWNKAVHEWLGRMHAAKSIGLQKKRWVTTAEILLDANGRYLQTIIHSSSGELNLDQFPHQVFSSQEIFPNPPKGLIGPDQIVRLNYRFQVEWDPQLYSRQ